MKNRYLLKKMAIIAGAAMVCISSRSVGAAEGDVAVNELNFPDAIFRDYVSATADTDKNNLLSAAELGAVTTINLRQKGITNLKGVENFKSLKTLNVSGNNLSAVPVSSNTNLTSLICDNNVIQTLDISGNRMLETLSASGNELTVADTSMNPKLMNVDLSYNQLTVVSFKNNKLLSEVNITGNDIHTLDMSENKSLISLKMSDNKLVLADLKANEQLTYLDCSYNKLITLELPAGLTALKANNNSLYNIDLTGAKSLKTLNVSGNRLFSLDLKSAEGLVMLDASNNNLAAIDLSANTELKQDSLIIGNNTREIYVNGSNEAYIEESGIVLDNILEIKEADCATGSALIIGKDSKLPETVNYTYKAGNDLKADFVIKPLSSKKLSVVKDKLDIYLVNDQKQPSYQFTAVPVGDKAVVKWSSADSKIASVDEYGKVTPVAAGTTTITASADGFDSVHISVNVVNEGVAASVSAIETQMYTGAEIKPEPAVKVGNTLLVKDRDYTLSYENNVKAGTATVTIKGINNYSFAITKKFNICYNIANMVADAIADQVFTGAEVRPDIVLKNGTDILVKDRDYTLTYSNNKALGTAIATITGKGEYTGSKIVSFNIIVPQVKNLAVSSYAAKSLTLKWDAIEGVSGYRIYKYNPLTKKYEYLKQLNGSAANTYKDEKLTAGTQYRYRVRAFVLDGTTKKYGKYTDKLKTYTKPKKVTLKAKAGLSGQRKAKLSWAKTTCTSGYRVYMKKGNGSFSRIADLKSGKISYTKTGLAKGTTYYFKVRAYVTINGKNVYGSYSTIKTVVGR